MRMLKGFREFIVRGNVVDLAVAVVIGTAFAAVVNALVKDILTPLIAAIAGEPDFSFLTFTIHKSTFRYGDLINSMIGFLLIAAAVYFFVVAPLNRLAESRAGRRAAGLDPDDTMAEKSEQIVVLEQIRDLFSSHRRV
jgi:large conductance mechanosensitive channel